MNHGQESQPVGCKGVYFVSSEHGRFDAINSTEMVEVIVVDERPVVLTFWPKYVKKFGIGQYTLDKTYDGIESIPEAYAPLVELFLNRVEEEEAAKILNPSGVVQTPEWMLRLDDLYVEQYQPNSLLRYAAAQEGWTKDGPPELLRAALQRASVKLPGEEGWLAPMGMYSRLPGEKYGVHPYFGTPPQEGDERWYQAGNTWMPYPIPIVPGQIRIDMAGFVGMSVQDNPAWSYLQQAKLLPNLGSRFALRDHHMQQVQEVLADPDKGDQLIAEFAARVPRHYLRFMRRGDLEMALRFPGEQMSVTDAPTLQIVTRGARFDTPAITRGIERVTSKGQQYATT